MFLDCSRLLQISLSFILCSLSSPLVAHLCFVPLILNTFLGILIHSTTLTLIHGRPAFLSYPCIHLAALSSPPLSLSCLSLSSSLLTLPPPSLIHGCSTLMAPALPPCLIHRSCVIIRCLTRTRQAWRGDSSSNVPGNVTIIIARLWEGRYCFRRCLSVSSFVCLSLFVTKTEFIYSHHIYTRSLNAYLKLIIFEKKT